MKVHLVNPSHIAFGISVITPRWLYVLAAATPAKFGDPVITDEMLAPVDENSIEPGDIVGIGIHTGNALRGYEVGAKARERGAFVVYGGIHATLYPEEAKQLGGAHAVVKGDGDLAWPKVLDDCLAGVVKPVYEAGRIDGGSFKSARWDLMLKDGTCGRLCKPFAMPQTLLLLFGVAHRWPATAVADGGCHGGRDHYPAPDGFSVRDAGR